MQITEKQRDIRIHEYIEKFINSNNVQTGGDVAPVF